MNIKKTAVCTDADISKIQGEKKFSVKALLCYMTSLCIYINVKKGFLVYQFIFIK